MTRILQIPQLNGSFGRFANKLLWYAMARWFCEKYDAVLQTPQWEGEHVFEINDAPMEGSPNILLSWPMSPDDEPWKGIAQLNTDKYSFVPQYSDDDFRRWLKFRQLYWRPAFPFETVAHVRRGDFVNENKWPIVSEETIAKGCEEHGLKNLEFVSEESPHINIGFPQKLSFMEDFLIMCHSQNLVVYPASSFSSCAARFNQGNVYIPQDYKNGPTECRWELRK